MVMGVLVNEGEREKERGWERGLWKVSVTGEGAAAWLVDTVDN